MSEDMYAAYERIAVLQTAVLDRQVSGAMRGQQCRLA
jgi:hypothetical protein